MGDPSEIERRASDQIRFAVVESRTDDRCIVRAGDLTSGAIPWFCFRAGETIIRSRPSIGEQGLLLCPEGEMQAGIFLPGVTSDRFPLPAGDSELVQFGDGCQISYDPASHVLRIAPPAGARIQVIADIEIEGDVQCSGDIVAGGVSLKNHLHAGVEPGPGVTGKPQ